VFSPDFSGKGSGFAKDDFRFVGAAAQRVAIFGKTRCPCRRIKKCKGR
jgi:hypothetical protein